MIKKLLISILILGGLLLIPFNVSATVIQVRDLPNADLLLSSDEIYEYQSSWEEVLNEIYFYPNLQTSNAVFNTYFVNYRQVAINAFNSSAYVDYNAPVTSGTTTDTFALNFVLYTDPVINIDDYYNYIIVEELNTTNKYSLIIDNQESINVMFEIYYEWNHTTEEIVYFEDYYNVSVNGGSTWYTVNNAVKIYLASSIVNLDHWTFNNGYYHWNGYEYTYQNYTTDLFKNYILDNLLPVATSQSNFVSLINGLVSELNNGDGLIIYVPTNLGVQLFATEWFLSGFSNGWYSPPVENVTQVNITTNNLVVTDINYANGTIGSAKANSITYKLNNNVAYQYEFEQYDNDNNLSIPFIGIRYIPNITFNVIFNTNGGTAVNTQTVTNNAYVTPVTTTRTGYDFIGWTNIATAEFNIPITQTTCDYCLVNYEWIPITSNRTYYAVWQPRLISVSFVRNGGNWTGTGYPIQEANNILKVPYNNTINNNVHSGITNINMVVSRPTYTFSGWYLDDEFNTAFNVATPLQQNITLYAKWTVGVIVLDEVGLIERLLDSVGLYNTGGFILIYIITIIILFSASLILGLPPMVLIIELIAVTALFMFMGMFSFWAIILIVLAIALGVIIEIRR